MLHNLKKYTWKQIRNDIKEINPGLTKVIDDFDPSDEYTIYKLEYPWGRHLLYEGTLCIPNSEGKWVNLHDPSIDQDIIDDLSYNVTMPLGMVVNNSIELYMNALGRLIPWIFMPAGTIFGLWVGLHNDKSTSNHTGKASNIVAGSRSALLLPKVSDAISFQKLKKSFGLQCRMPETLTDQWPLLVELSQHPSFTEQWSTSVIYFSKKWLEPKDDFTWKMFRHYLLEIAWEKTSYLRNQVLFDIVFSCALEEKNLKPNPYLTDTVKHLFAISQNNAPGYTVATDNSILPLDGFQTIFLDVYGLRYQPTFMVPEYLNSDFSKSLYYSLEVPTLMSFSPKSKKIANKLGDLREIKYMVQLIIEYLQKDNLKLKSVFKFTNEVCFEYYHTDEDVYNETIKTSELQKIDQNIIKESKKFDKEFCDTSPFLRGCARISLKHHT